MNAGRARTFFALWPDADVRDRLATAAAEAKAECRGRATAPEKIHLTLFFVGDVERSRLQRLAHRASAVEGRQFSLGMSTIGYWRHNRIVWAGTDDRPPELATLVSTLNAALTQEGLTADERPYVPHVTLVRDARRAPSRRTLDAMPLWHVREFVLVESAPADRGTRYEVVARFPLETPPQSNAVAV